MFTGTLLLFVGAVLTFSGLLLPPSQELGLMVGKIVQAGMIFAGVVVVAIGAATVEIVSEIRDHRK